MTLGLRELRRRPGRFGVVTFALVLLVVLLMLLGGLLDGLFLGSTGALRAQRADLIVYDADARESFVRSRISPELRDRVEAVDGVTGAAGLGAAQVGARIPGESEVADAAVLGYEVALDGVPAPPPPGRAYADRTLEGAGAELGDVVLAGPGEVPLEIVGFVDDTNYLGQSSLWVEPGTWREVQSAARPDDTVPAGTFQVLTVQAAGEPTALARRIDEATGATDTLTKDDAVLSTPGAREQNGVFSLLIGTTLFACGLVTALFFALLVIERLPLFATLKALGARSRTLFAGVVVQALAIAAVALTAGLALSYALAQFVPPGVPLDLQVSRAITNGVLLLATAALGAALSLRRITRIDPASAIGSA